MSVSENPKIYHIVHIDRLASILSDESLLSDGVITSRENSGTNIGMNKIKERRLNELTLNSYPDLRVGQCVPFYFCPRSVMLYMMHRGNHAELAYDGGQVPIIHLEADLNKTVEWANNNGKRWAFTLSNAGSYYFEDRNDLCCLNEINWNAVKTHSWQGLQEDKQAEFLIEEVFPWHLVEKIGVIDQTMANQVITKIQSSVHKPRVEITRSWYY